jgi:2-polyprenyl-3-methyl-5-hydroxy-6-metoxy-1,4-benzoquinol methylase
MTSSYKDILINTSKNTHETVMEMIDKDKNAKIIDIPCGADAFILRLKDNGFKDVLGIDIENLLQIDHKNFKQGDMTNSLPLENSSCDCIVCIDGIEHITKQFDFIKEANRVLKNGGELIISTPNISSIRSRWKWLMTGHHHKCVAPLDENNPTPLHHINMISFHELRYMLHTNGFKITDIKVNRKKLISYIYSIFIPFIYLNTFFVYYKEGKKGNTRQINKEIFQKMFSKDLLFGETLIVKACKETH